MASDRASVDCLERLLKRKPFPRPFKASDLENCGVSIDAERSGSGEISTLEVARQYLILQGYTERSFRSSALVIEISHLRRLGQSFIDGEVSARLFADIFLSLYQGAANFASAHGLRALGALERYWVDIDVYPDLEEDKRTEGMTDDRKLKETALEVIKIIDELWEEMTHAELPGRPPS